MNRPLYFACAGLIGVTLAHLAIVFCGVTRPAHQAVVVAVGVVAAVLTAWVLEARP